MARIGAIALLVSFATGAAGDAHNHTHAHTGNDTNTTMMTNTHSGGNATTATATTTTSTPTGTTHTATATTTTSTPTGTTHSGGNATTATATTTMPTPTGTTGTATATTTGVATATSTGATGTTVTSATMTSTTGTATEMSATTTSGLQEGELKITGEIGMFLEQDKVDAMFDDSTAAAGKKTLFEKSVCAGISNITGVSTDHMTCVASKVTTSRRLDSHAGASNIKVDYTITLRKDDLPSDTASTSAWAAAVSAEIRDAPKEELASAIQTAMNDNGVGGTIQVKSIATPKVADGNGQASSCYSYKGLVRFVIPWMVAGVAVPFA